MTVASMKGLSSPSSSSPTLLVLFTLAILSCFAYLRSFIHYMKCLEMLAKVRKGIAASPNGLKSNSVINGLSSTSGLGGIPTPPPPSLCFPSSFPFPFGTTLSRISARSWDNKQPATLAFQSVRTSGYQIQQYWPGQIQHLLQAGPIVFSPSYIVGWCVLFLLLLKIIFCNESCACASLRAIGSLACKRLEFVCNCSIKHIVNDVIIFFLPSPAKCSL